MAIKRGTAAFLSVIFLLAGLYLHAQQTELYYLSGTGKDDTVQWDFFCTKGQRSGNWTKIAVPSNWELQGFGSYMYGNGKDRSDEQGIYRYAFPAAASWKNKKVFIVFEGVMTDAEVSINGRSAGPVHQGGFYRFGYDISSLLMYNDSNELEVKVSKQSSDPSVNRAEREGDFWALSGIFRPVYLEIVPASFIEHIAVDAKADGSYKVEVSAKNFIKGDVLEAQVRELNGLHLGKPFGSPVLSGRTSLEKKFEGIIPWNPENPRLYEVIVSLKRNNGVIHSISRRFGFRTAEMRPRDGFYVNGVKVIFKGVNRHSAWPETGRTLSKAISVMDVQLMKEMNMNAVRMSHYPPDQHFLDVCDSLGLFVLNELTGWQAAYDTAIGRKLVKELVERDVNHPSVVMWANGNEGGWNRALDKDFDLYDPQHRFVYHPFEKFNGTDTKHYPEYSYVVNSILYDHDVFFPTEFMHGLYDGGHGAGLQDFWNLMLQHPYNAGGFLWVFADEGVVRVDQHDSIDTDGNHAPDGILGPYREKEASFYTIKDIWSPVFIAQKNIPAGFDGKLKVVNRYLYTNLSQCSFNWKLVSFPRAADTTIQYIMNAGGKLPRLSLAPGKEDFLQLPLPANWKDSDALYLTAVDKNGRELFTWNWPVPTAAQMTERAIAAYRPSGGAISARDSSGYLVIRNGSVSCYFSQATGFLDKVVSSQTALSLSGGPVMAGVSLSLTSFRHYAEGSNYIVETAYAGDEGQAGFKWIFTAGKPIKLDYSYTQKGEADFIGFTMNFPEEKITGMKWLGRGPFRVWKNRMQGTGFNVWHKTYNNTVTGESWVYPEFKGYHAETRWVTVENTEKPFTVYSETDHLFFQMLTPGKPKGASNDNTSPAFPAGNLGFMFAIPPIGTKFQEAKEMGPQSQKNYQLNKRPISGSLWFDF